ncbi:uncharacterized protein LOC117646301 [Thrips palmi]|uniref:Uncharacterized protein LOC117646301 n=1 Tax=Thrips palmi TaxID=161013 RepID=A0A6P8ZNX1_THRPL|nr:uncharacterized protein LOC117646301 [Thrips palmi]
MDRSRSVNMGLRRSACACGVFLVVLYACLAVAHEDASNPVPLPLLLESLRSDILHLPDVPDVRRVSRGVGVGANDAVLADAAVPWYSPATRDDDNSAARDELQVTALIKDEAFNYGAGVNKWYSLVVGSTTHLVGLGSSKELTLLTATFVSPDVGSGHTYSLVQKKFALSGTPLAAGLFKHWNAVSKTLDAILVLSVDSDDGILMWYRITASGLDNIRPPWPVHKKASNLKVFQVRDRMKLLILTSCESSLEILPCMASADLYDFSLDAHLDPKLSQSITLEEEAVTAEVGAVGEEIYLALALPQASAVKLYRYVWPLPSEISGIGNHSIYGWFDPFWKDLHSPRVAHAVFFHVSYKMYLAVGGESPTVHRFVSPTRIEIVPKALEGIGFVSTWVVLPVPTFRDEVILLAEVLHSESAPVMKEVVTLTWSSSGIFKWQNQPPCFVGGVKFPVEGASCLIAGGDESRLYGAVAYRVGDSSVVSVLLPRGKQASSVYRIFTQLQPVLNPLLAEVFILKDAQAKLKDELMNQIFEMDRTEKLLLDTLSVNEPNIIKADWVISEVETPELENTGTLPPINEPDWTPEDQLVKIQELRELLNLLRNSTESLLGSLEDAAVPVNGELHLDDYQALLGGVEVTNHAEFDSLSVSVLNGEPVPSLLKEIVRVDRVDKIGGTKTLSKVKVVDVDFVTVNNIQRDDLVFNIPNKPVRLYGNLEVTQFLNVEQNVDLPSSGTFGGIDLSEEIFIPGRAFQGVVHFDEVTVEGDLTVDVINNVAMSPRNLKSMVSGQNNLQNVTRLDSLSVAGSVQVERVNGFSWSDLVKRLVWKNESTIIEGHTKIQGTLTSEQIENRQLNGLDFPADFVLKTTESQHIIAKKTMKNGLFVGSLDVSNTVDRVPVNSFVTLRTNQHLDGELTLSEADIKGDVKVDWAVNGIRLNQMNSQSPLINEGSVVSSNVLFKNLEVLGPIQITGLLDGRVFKDDILNVVVLPSSANDTVLISGKKIVTGSLKVDGLGITISSGFVNGKKVSDIARLDQSQEFHGEKSIQHAVFGNIQLTGVWDDVNVVDLNAEAVRLTGTQDTNTHLNFIDPSKLFASRLLITEQLNTHVASTASSLLSDGVCSVDNCVIQGPVNVNFMKVAGNVVINGKVCNWNLVDFETRRVSRSRPQTISGNISFGNMNVKSHVNISALNNVPLQNFKKRVLPNFSSYEDLEKLLLSGGFAVDELFIEGNIRTTSGVNFLNLAKIAQNAVKLTGGNTFSGSLFFEDSLSVGSLDVRGPVNRFNLAYMIEDAVLRNDLQPVTISGIKRFDAGFTVEGSIVTNNLNGFEPSKIITKSSSASILGSLRVLGGVYAGNVNVSGLLNGIPVLAFLNRYKYLGGDRHELLGNAHFLEGVAVDDLYVMNSVNGVHLEQFFKSTVMKDEPSRIPGIKLFVNRVAFTVVDVTGLVNNLLLREMVQDVVLINDDKPVVINGSITIANDLSAPAGVSLTENLIALELDGCLIKEWVDNAIYLNKPTDILGFKTFASMSSNSDLSLSVINALDLSKVITLKDPQKIPSNVRILTAAMRHNVKVDGLVNGRLLQSEYDNTLMSTGNQIVSGSKTFLSGLTVRNDVLIKGYISGRDITNVVTLEDNEAVNGPLKFTNVVVGGDMRVSSLISGLDVTQWNERAFLTRSTQPQLITGSWDVKGQVRFMERVGGHGLLGGQNVNNFPEFIRETREFNRKTQAAIKDEWVQLCRDTDALLAKARAQPFLFQQLEVVQAIQSSKKIASMHAFEALNEQFLAVSYTDLCSGAMYRWNRQRTAWDLLDEAVQNIGSVEKWATLRNPEATYLITSAAQEHNCPYQGGNVWRFEPSVKLRNVYTMDPWHDVSVDQEAGRLHLLGRSGVHTWSLEDGDVKLVSNSSIPESSRSQFLPRSAGLGLSVTDGKSVTVLEGPGFNATQVSRSANSNLPAWSRGNVVAMKIADGRKLVAVSAEGSDLLVVYEDVATGQSLARVQVENAHSLSVMELTAPGRNGQTLLAFIENERHLRVVQYKGVEGFVDVTEAKLAVSVKEMVPVRLFTRGLVNQRHFLLLRSDLQVLSLEVEMAGDPLDETPLNCNLV